MQIKLENIILLFEELSLRMRLLLTFCLVAVIFMLFDIFLFSANEKTIKTKQQQNINSKKQIADLVSLQNEFNQKTFTSRSDPKTKLLERLDAELEKIRQKLTEHTTNLIHPKDMSSVLKDILSSTKNLQLQSLLKQETVDLSDSEKTDQGIDKPGNKEQVTLYRHSVEISLYGDYHSTLSFLQKLETMEKKVAFDNLEYVVDSYPKANIKLMISTLSLQPGWIGG